MESYEVQLKDFKKAEQELTGKERVFISQDNNTRSTTIDEIRKPLAEQLNETAQKLDTVYKGLCIRAWLTGYLNGQDMRTMAPDILNRISGDSVQLNINHYQETLTSSSITESPIGIEEVRGYVRYMKSKGYKVMAKPQVEIKTNEWRANIDPSDIDSWFSSYKTLILSYANMCEEEKVEILSIGSEYHKLTKKYPNKWIELIKEVREVFSGQLTYSASFNTAWADEAIAISFWDLLDVIGVNYYTRINYNVDNEPYDKDMVASYFQIDAQNADPFVALNKLADKYGRNIIFTEFGVPFSSTGSDLRVSDDYLVKHFDSLLSKAFKMPWFRGGFIWVCDPLGTKDMFSEDRKISSTIKEYYSLKLERSNNKVITNDSLTYRGPNGYAPIVEINMPKRSYQSENIRVKIIGGASNTNYIPETEIFIHVGTGLTGEVESIELKRMFGNIPSDNIGYSKEGNRVIVYVKLTSDFEYRIVEIYNTAPDWGKTVHLGDVVSSVPSNYVKASIYPITKVVSTEDLMSGNKTFTWHENSTFRRYKLNGNLTLNLNKGTVGLATSVIVSFRQDSTGYRTLTLDTSIKQIGIPVRLNNIPNSVTLVEFFWDGETWNAWCTSATNLVPYKTDLTPSIGTTSDSYIKAICSANTVEISFELTITASLTANVSTPIFYVPDFQSATKYFGLLIGEAGVIGDFTIDGGVVTGKVYSTLSEQTKIKGSATYISIT